MAIVTLLQELFSGRAMRPAAGTHLQLVEQAVIPRADPELLEVLDQLQSAEAATAAREEPAIAIDRDEPEVVADRAEPTMVVAVNDDRELPLIATPTAAPAEEPELSLVPASGEVRAPISADSAPAGRVEPIRREPLPEMRLRRESFREAWAEHKRREEEAAWREPAAIDPMDEEDDDEEPIMRNPFARRKPAPMPEPVEPMPAPARSSLGEVGIESAAERLIAGGATRAIFVSPEGDEGAAAAVMVAREVADAGLRVLLIDLTASGAASRPMLDGVSYPGITNLLASEAQFTDAIHTDHYSDCHVMPVGTANPARAMRAADRLPIIMESLTTAYDVVVVECGPADAESIRRLVADGTEIMVSVIEPDDEVAAAAEALKAGGYRRIMLVTPADYQSPNAPVPGRSAA